MNKKIREISIINVFLCLTVVLIHLLGLPVGNSAIGTFNYNFYSLMHRLSSFVVQGFIFLSSMKLFLNGRRQKYGKFILKRIKNIFIPYVIAVTVYYLYFVYVLKYFPFTIKHLASYIIHGDVAAQFYFIVVIMQFYLLYPLWCYIVDKFKAIHVIAVSAIVTVIFGFYGAFFMNKITGGYEYPYLDRLFTTYVLYWTGGIYAGIYYDKFADTIKKYRVIIFAAFVVMGVLDGVTLLMNKYGLIIPRHLNFVHGVYCITAIGVCFATADLLKKVKASLTDKIDKGSYKIYLYHILIILILDNQIGNFGIESTTLLFVIRFVIIYASIYLMVW